MLTFCNGAALQQITVSQRLAIATNFLSRGVSSANAKVFPSIIRERGGLTRLLPSDDRLCVGDIVKFCHAVSSLSVIWSKRSLHSACKRRTKSFLIHLHTFTFWRVLNISFITIYYIILKTKKIQRFTQSRPQSRKPVIRKYQSPAGNYIFKVNNKITRTRCEICSKLTIKTPERCIWGRSGVFIVNFEHTSHLILEFLLLTLSR